MANKEKYIEVLSKAVKELSKDAPIKISLKCVEDILELLKEQETIVHCKDCKFAKKSVRHSKEDEYKCILSEFEGLYDYHNKDWFCADGERNDENG